MNARLSSSRYARLGGPVWVAVLLAGCGGHDELASPAAAHLRSLATIYLDYAVATGRGPEDEEQLRGHVAKMGPFAVESVAALDDLFVSERDKERFVIRYGQSLDALAQNIVPSLIAYENTGRNDRRLAVDLRGEVRLLDADAWRRLSVPSPSAEQARPSPAAQPSGAAR